MELLIGGLASGSITALIALGVVMVFRATGIVNFAQGELLMIGAYSYVLASRMTDSPVLQIAIALSAGAIGGLVCFEVTHFFLRGASDIVLVIGTLALLIFAQSGARIIFTDNPQRAVGWISGSANINIFGASIAVNSILTLIVSAIAAAALLVWLGFTRVGHSVQAAAEDSWRASLTGVHVRRTLGLSWAIGGALAAMAGVFLSPITGVYPTMGADVILSAFVAVSIGGFKSLTGALLGGLIVGVVQTYAVTYLGGAFRDVVLFVILLGLLLWRPTGLFQGRKTRVV